MSINQVTPFTGSFLPQGGKGVLCGEVFGLTLLNSTLEQAISNVADKSLLQGMPVTVSNALAGTDGTNILQQYNPSTFSISAVATTSATTDGFCVWGMTDYADLESMSIGYPRKGVLTAVALIGSGLYVWLPADATLKNVRISSKVKWDATSGGLVLDAAGTDALPIKIRSSLVDGQKVATTTDGTGNTVIKWVDTKAILVQL